MGAARTTSAWLSGLSSFSTVNIQSKKFHLEDERVKLGAAPPLGPAALVPGVPHVRGVVDGGPAAVPRHPPPVLRHKHILGWKQGHDRHEGHRTTAGGHERLAHVHRDHAACRKPRSRLGPGSHTGPTTVSSTTQGPGEQAPSSLGLHSRTQAGGQGDGCPNSAALTRTVSIHQAPAVSQARAERADCPALAPRATW